MIRLTDFHSNQLSFDTVSDTFQFLRSHYQTVSFVRYWISFHRLIEKIFLIVLYGEIPLDDMELFNQILEEKQAKYLFLLDSDGNYIVRYGITLKEKSLIETLDMVRFDKDNPQVHNSTQVLEKMKKKEEILYAINRGQNEEIGVLTPIPDSSSVGVALMPDHGIDWIMFPA